MPENQLHLSMIDQITPLVLTFNEAPNIGRVLQRLTWAKRILVVDSFSDDATLEIVRGFKQAEIVQRKFDTFAGQCNFGLQQIRTPWVLSLDADYVLGGGFEDELKTLNPSENVAGYRAAFTYCVHGRPLRASLYPPRTVLYRRELARYVDEGHGHRVQITGAVRALHSRILHDDRKPFERWLDEQNRYALREVENLTATPSDQLNRADRIRKKILVAPVLIFFYTLFVRGLILNGWPGWYYVLQRTLAEIILSLRLIEHRMQQRTVARSQKPDVTDTNKTPKRPL